MIVALVPRHPLILEDVICWMGMGVGCRTHSRVLIENGLRHLIMELTWVGFGFSGKFARNILWVEKGIKHHPPGVAQQLLPRE